MTGTPAVVQLAAFLVGPHEYAVDIMKIKEIINPLAITAVPGAPSFIEGVVELRGAIFPIVDLRKRFGLPATPPARTTKYIVVAISGRIVGLIVDATTNLLRKAPSDIRQAPPLEPGGGEVSTFFSGVVHHDGKIIMILDIDRVLSSQEKGSLVGMGADSVAR